MNISSLSNYSSYSIGQMNYSRNNQVAMSGEHTSGKKPNLDPDIKNFLDKMRDGTATDDDLTNIMSTLQAKSTEDTASTTQSTSGTDDIGSFIDKLKNGSATAEDMQDIMSKMKERASLGFHQSMMNGGMTSLPFNLTGSASQAENGADSTLKSLLDKMRDGTATAEDLTNAMSTFTNATSDSTSSSTSTTSASSTEPIKSFFDKLKDGTATESDMKSAMDAMKNEGAQGHQGMRPMGPPPPPPPSGDKSGSNDSESDDTDSDIVSLLKKMQNGTATADDLADTLAKLAEDATYNTSSTSSSSSVTGTSSTSDTSSSKNSFDTDLKSFIEKVKKGTATEDDLKTMMSEMKEARGHRPPPPPMGGLEPASNSNSTSSTTSSTSDQDDSQYLSGMVKQLFDSYMKAYTNGSYEYQNSLQNLMV
ncbi:hypothetical protein GJ688_04310 [Heliobacillus mobilis]|uniref:Uncharacterized protein n=1 Tax=Heliobacterium mobile TaxID=28064 RepID=A0A6I3SHM3_HELMO|nr:hypothetical protein [Heliobacterium mobile]MTV48207.1 hypothetical protein [Heliobacterium mobile]